MDESDLRLKEVKTEQVLLNKSSKRAIWLDVWALDWTELVQRGNAQGQASWLT